MSRRYQFGFGDVKAEGNHAGTRHARNEGGSATSAGQLAFENIVQGFDRQFHEQKGLGDEVVAATQCGAGAALEVGQPGDKHDGRFGVSGQGAQFGAQFKAVHARHIDIEKDEVEQIFGKHIQREVRVFHADAFQVGFFQRVNDGPARNRLVVHNHDVRRREIVRVLCAAVFEQYGEKINRVRQGAQGRGVEVLRLLVKLLA